MERVSEPTDRKAADNASLTRIRDLWRCLHTKKDLLKLVNVAVEALYGEMASTVTMGQLNRTAYSSVNPDRYHSFLVPKKKRGVFRTIDAPEPTLKYIQQGLNLVLQTVYTPHSAATGFVPHRSVVTGAKMHLNQRFVYNIDLKDFFHSITSGRLYSRLTAKPFCLDGKVAGIITDICCYTGPDGRNVLPMGAPTSPTITNIICERMDTKLTRLAKAYGLKYSRYADDITFSGMANVFDEDGHFIKSMQHIIEQEEGFAINPDKTRLCHRGMRQEVTGLTVEEIRRAYKGKCKSLNPDVNQSPDATNKMQEVNEAYRVLHDQYLRLQYDKECISSATATEYPSPDEDDYCDVHSEADGFDPMRSWRERTETESYVNQNWHRYSSPDNWYHFSSKKKQRRAD